MRKTFLSVVLPLIMLPAYAQFTKAVKDSVLAQLTYPVATYNISICFDWLDYADLPANELYTLGKDSLLARIKGNNRDASIYGALFTRAYNIDKNYAVASKYMGEAYTRYQKWINDEKENPQPVLELLTLCNNTANPALAKNILDYALPLFPGNIYLLQHAIYYYQIVAVDFNQAQSYIDKVFRLDPGNIKTMSDQVTFYYSRFLNSLNGTVTIDIPETPELKNAIAAHPENPAYVHIDHYRYLLEMYLKCVNRYIAAKTGDIMLFSYCQPTNEETEQLNRIAGWLTQQAEKKGKNQAVMLNSLGVIACIQKSYEKAYVYFRQASSVKQACSAGESAILTSIFQKNYPRLEKDLKEKIAKDKNPLDYSSLLKVYRKYMPDIDKEKSVLNELKALNITNPDKEQVLATGYLLTGQIKLSQQLLPQLSDENVTNLLIKTTAAVLNDDRGLAAQYLEKAEQLDPRNEDMLKIKAFTGL